MTFITLPEHAYAFLKSQISYEVEEVWCLALSSNKKLKKAQCLFRGSVDSCLVHPREIFHFAIINQASDILLAHSHPSGDSTPSQADLNFTKKIQLTSCFFEITVLDHLIMTEEGYTSLLTSGYMEPQDTLNEELKRFFQWPAQE